MTLGEAQRIFSLNIAHLIEMMYAEGYECALDWAFRPEEFAELYAHMKVGVPNSIHEWKLGQDLDLFKDGVFLSGTEDHRPFGDYWKTLHPDNFWGGDIPGRPDGDHYSMRFGGRA